jgi:hypothetical protein
MAPVIHEEPASAVPAAPGDTAGLAGTSWRLVERQSMDDAQGTTKPDDPAKYTLGFGADGQVAVQLDCNRGTGAWHAQPSGDGSGSIEIGPLATTRALCPEPSLGERIAADLGYVRGYLIRDGRLHLSLMADGGILVFEPAEAAR